MNEKGDIIELDKSQRIEMIKSSTRSKMLTYRMINPSFEIHPIYKSGLYIEDYLRTAFTRFRTSSHRLKIETGRWSRIPREQRLCQCGEGIQTEQHILTACTLVDTIKTKYGHDVINFTSFMCGEKTKHELLMLYDILHLLEK